MKKPTPPPSTQTCVLRIVVLLILVIILFTAFALATAIDNWQHQAPRPIQMVPPSCGAIIETDGSIVCQNTGLDPTDTQLQDWLHAGHSIIRQGY